MKYREIHILQCVSREHIKMDNFVSAVVLYVLLM